MSDQTSHQCKSIILLFFVIVPMKMIDHSPCTDLTDHFYVQHYTLVFFLH